MSDPLKKSMIPSVWNKAASAIRSIPISRLNLDLLLLSSSPNISSIERWVSDSNIQKIINCFSYYKVYNAHLSI